MPTILGKPVVKRIMLPMYPEETWIDCLSNPSADILENVGKDPDKTFNDQLLSVIVQAWSFVDESGQALPINIENITKLSPLDKLFVLKTLGLMDLFSVSKKNS